MTTDAMPTHPVLPGGAAPELEPPVVGAEPFRLADRAPNIS